jgi:hypothetical protein
MTRTGGITFQVHATAEYQFFYMREDTPVGQVVVPPFSLHRSHPRNLNALPEDADMGVVEVMLARLHEMITKEHLRGINLVSIWIVRRIAPLKLQATLMCHYTDTNDDSQLNALSWNEGGSESWVKKILTLPPSELMGSKFAYLHMNPAPAVSTFFADFPWVSSCLSLACFPLSPQPFQDFEMADRLPPLALDTPLAAAPFVGKDNDGVS